MIEDRLSTNSSNEEIFNEAARMYDDALKKSGYSHKLKYRPPKPTHKKKKGRNIIWFNPPYNRAVSTNVGRIFLSLIDRHFGGDPELHKLFNRNNIKVSYRTGRNIKAKIDGHNNTKLRTGNAEEKG